MWERIPIGTVLHMYCPLAGKDKFHVVCCIDPKPLAFLINSEVTAYARKNKHLLVCHAEIKQNEHEFLNHDSFVECCEPISLVNVEEADIDIIGELSSDAKQAVCAAVTSSRVMVVRQKEWILKALDS